MRKTENWELKKKIKKLKINRKFNKNCINNEKIEEKIANWRRKEKRENEWTVFITSKVSIYSCFHNQKVIWNCVMIIKVQCSWECWNYFSDPKPAFLNCVSADVSFLTGYHGINLLLFLLLISYTELTVWEQYVVLCLLLYSRLDSLPSQTANVAMSHARRLQ